jgi:predicted RNase H-like HicB family nuclease
MLDRRRSLMVTLTAVVHREEDVYVAECPEVGTASQGETIEEAVQNLKEATELYLEEFPLERFDRSFVTTFEVAKVAGT